MAADLDTQLDAEEQGAWGRPVPARHGEALMAVALLAVAIFFISQAALLPFGKVGLPGPGFFPFVLGIALALFLLVILYRTLREPARAEVTYFGHRDVLVVLASLAGMAFAFERVDTYLLLGTFAAVLLLLVARAALWRVLLGAILGMIAVWAVFNLALGVRLPASEIWGQLVSGFPSGAF